jgi:hypothetical protein
MKTSLKKTPQNKQKDKKPKNMIGKHIQPRRQIMKLGKTYNKTWLKKET